MNRSPTANDCIVLVCAVALVLLAAGILLFHRSLFGSDFRIPLDAAAQDQLHEIKVR